MLVALLAVLVWCAASVVLAVVLASVLRRADAREGTTGGGTGGAPAARRDDLVLALAGGADGWSEAVVAPLLARMADDERARQPGARADGAAVRRGGSAPDAPPGPTGRSTRG